MHKIGTTVTKQICTINLWSDTIVFHSNSTLDDGISHSFPHTPYLFQVLFFRNAFAYSHLVEVVASVVCELVSAIQQEAVAVLSRRQLTTSFDSLLNAHRHEVQHLLSESNVQLRGQVDVHRSLLLHHRSVIHVSHGTLIVVLAPAVAVAGQRQKPQLVHKIGSALQQRAGGRLRAGVLGEVVQNKPQRGVHKASADPNKMSVSLWETVRVIWRYQTLSPISMY